MRFGFKQPLLGEKRCGATLITAAEETTSGKNAQFTLLNRGPISSFLARVMIILCNKPKNCIATLIYSYEMIG